MVKAVSSAGLAWHLPGGSDLRALGGVSEEEAAGGGRRRQDEEEEVTGIVRCGAMKVRCILKAVQQQQ